jgi:branched-chain amino acid transport system ATP-binding protein
VPREGDAVLALKDVHTYYGDSYALQGVSLEVREGQIVALLGRNGMGKTTTIRSIIGFNPPRRGEVLFKGTSIAGKRAFDISQMGIGLIPQGRRIFPSLSVRENLMVTARAHGKSTPWTLDRVYGMFPILKERAKNQGTDLSGGEQQMLAIGRALMTNADLLLMDEPSEGLAPLIVRGIGDLILTLRREGLSILLVEQNVAMATKVADYVYVISNGQIVFAGDVAAFKADDVVQRQFIGVQVAGGSFDSGTGPRAPAAGENKTSERS